MPADTIRRIPVALLVAEAIGHLAIATNAHEEDRPGGVAEALSNLHKTLLHLEELTGCVTPTALFI